MSRLSLTKTNTHGKINHKVERDTQSKLKSPTYGQKVGKSWQTRKQRHR